MLSKQDVFQSQVVEKIVQLKSIGLKAYCSAMRFTSFSYGKTVS